MAGSLEEALGIHYKFIINNDLRTIEVPDGIVFGVYNDRNVQTIDFEMPRYYHGDLDLSEFAIRINYMTGGQGNIYLVEDKVASSNKITFTWTVDIGAYLQNGGSVTFSVCLRKVNQSDEVTHEFNTTIYTVKVLEGLEVEPADPVVVHDYLTQIQQIIENLEETAEQMAEDIAEEVRQSIPQDYTALSDEVSDLNQALTQVETEIGNEINGDTFTWAIGEIKADGSQGSSTTNIRTIHIPVKKGNTVVFLDNVNYVYAVFQYSSASAAGFEKIVKVYDDKQKDLEIEKDCYIRITMRYTDRRTVTDEDLTILPKTITIIDSGLYQRMYDAESDISDLQDRTDEIEAITVEEFRSEYEWLQGYYGTSDGASHSSSTSIRSINYIDEKVLTISGDNMKYRLLAYDKDDEYIGCWGTNGWSKVSANDLFMNKVNMDSFRKQYPYYKFKISAAFIDSSAISPSDYENILIRRIPKQLNYADELSAASSANASANTKKKYLSFAGITDIHGTGGSFETFIDFCNKNAGYFDFGICLGDSVTNTPADSSAFIPAEIDKSVVPVFYEVGNHDVALQNSKAISEATCRTRYFEKIEEKEFLIASDFMGAGKCSWYKDFANYKIRIVALFEYGDSFDSESASEVQRSNACRGLSSETLQWFADTLYSTPSDYSVIVFLHQIPNRTDVFVNHDFCISETLRSDYAWSSSAYFMNNMTGSPICDVVNAFKNSLSINSTYTDTFTEQTTQVVKDFSQRTNGKFICYFCGHTHIPVIYRDETYSDQITVVLPSGSRRISTQAGDIPNREFYDDRDNFYSIGIDTDHKLINLVQIGAHVTKDMRIRRVANLPYGN